MPAIQPIGDADLQAVLALNQAHATELSSLDEPALRRLVRIAYHARTVPGAGAFLIAFDHDSPYEGGNFQWFRARHARFVYIDRVAVAAARRGQGLARALYADLFAQARQDHFPLATCEVNLDPPNPGSDRFHTALGFRPVGQERLSNGKTVRYLTAPLAKTLTD